MAGWQADCSVVIHAVMGTIFPTRLRNKSGELLVLRRKPRITGWLALGWRVVAVVGLLSLLIAIHWLERDGLKDSHDRVVSFLDVVYFTMISATTTGYGDIVPVTDTTRMFDAIVVTPIRVLFLLILAGSAYAFVARRSWERFVMKKIQSNLCDHIVVAGFGTKNSRAVLELIARGAEPHNIVVIDTIEDRLERAKALGCTILKADATRDETLRAVHVNRAKLMIISAGRDDTSILICLTARHHAPDLRISLAVNAEDNVAPARLAGADVVVNPLDFAGLLLRRSGGLRSHNNPVSFRGARSCPPARNGLQQASASRSRGWAHCPPAQPTAWWVLPTATRPDSSRCSAR
jgi:voltage-gated potassium channel